MLNVNKFLNVKNKVIKYFNGELYFSDNIKLINIKSNKNDKFKTIEYDIPTEFNSWDDMVKWYENEYFPKTYKIIEKQAFEIIKQLKKKNEI
jgi:hypothetical protein